MFYSDDSLYLKVHSDLESSLSVCVLITVDGLTVSSWQPPAGLDWLQVHAVDEVIRFLCGEGPGLPYLVTNQSDTAADDEEEQQKGGDDESQR